MKRKQLLFATLVLVLLAALLLLLSRYYTRLSMPPDTDLEYFITETISPEDFAGHTERYGLMGGREYYGAGYTPTLDENGQQVDPAQCVIYTVTSYPDYMFGSSHITRIAVTDPTVSVWGLTLDSPAGTVIDRMKDAGYRYRKLDGLTFTRGRVTVRFTNQAIYISASVSNIMGIQF